MTSTIARVAYNRLARIGGVKLTGLDRGCCGGAPYTRGRAGRLKLSSAQANSSTGLLLLNFVYTVNERTLLFIDAIHIDDDKRLVYTV